MSLTTNKIEAAHRQIDAAIRMFFAAEDPFAVHSVISAAERIVRDLAEHSGKSSIHETIKLYIRPGMEKKFWSEFNKCANFLKHADADPNALLEFNEQVNDVGIATCCLYYKSLGYQPTADMSGFIWWYTVMNPDLLVETAPLKKILSKSHFEKIRTLPRSDQLAFGRQLCALIKEQMPSA